MIWNFQMDLTPILKYRNMDIEKIFELRCKNKSVKYISKKTGISVPDIEKKITENIMETDDIINEIIKKRGKIETFKKNHMLEIDPDRITMDRILNDKDIIDYICLKASDHHDRFMDCIRYIIRKNIRK
ncbi:hypothetical protein ACNF40_05440 [Cuniculiplasma sp. SKW4]|uniref:hypothetical protein n=1 Tax=Cuniculiplasma sp. SKW4 TaxID=3400171 RepID=UPI003FCF5BA4